MAVKIRLKRCGKKKEPTYRIIIIDSKQPRDGEAIEVLGQYFPIATENRLVIKEDRAKYWLGVGAEPSDVVQRVFSEFGLLPKIKKVPVNPGVSKKSLKAAQEEKK